jgi:5'-nucleotidase/UDP-sugar diphosphatase
VEGQTSTWPDQQIRLTILHTSDIHSRLLPYDFRPLRTDIDLGLIPEAGPFGGATRMASIIKRERRRPTACCTSTRATAFRARRSSTSTSAR